MPTPAGRRAFLRSMLRSTLALPTVPALAARAQAARGAGPPPASPPARPLAERFADLRRRFVFEYYPWYGVDPWRHWDAEDRLPPHDLASPHMPRLGAYDSRSRAVLERHARWIADSGVGSVNLSWWGPGSFEDRAAPLILDVMRDHDLKVSFHLEPYRDDRVRYLVGDALYLLREFGERRRFDSFLLLRDHAGSPGPVLKAFGTLAPREVVDCHGRRTPAPDYVPDGEWRRQLDALRRTLRGDFDHVTFLSDSLDIQRVRAADFDGIAVYDNFLSPSSYATHAAAASRAGLLFSFNVNPGFDLVEPRSIDPDSCYEPKFAPGPERPDWSRPEERERAAALAEERIRASLGATLQAQSDPELTNSRRGFFLVYVNSFNEWHEGHAFEPMKDAAELSEAERQVGYHNPARGAHRLELLAALLRPLLAAAAPGPPTTEATPSVPWRVGRGEETSSGTPPCRRS